MSGTSCDTNDNSVWKRSLRLAKLRLSRKTRRPPNKRLMWATSMKTPDNKDENWWVVLSTPTPSNPKDERWTTRLWRETCEVSISDWLMVLFTAVLAYYASSQYAEMHNAGQQTDR